MLGLAMVILLSVVLLGCAHTQQATEKYSFGKALTGTKEINRDEFVKNLETQHDLITAKVQQALKIMKKEADQRSVLRLSLDGAGILAGIASAGLIVASPANAVTVAVLNGFATGVLAFETSTGAEGLNRASMLIVYNNTMRQMVDAENAYEGAYQTLLQKRAAEEQVWRDAAAAAAVALNRYDNTTLFRSLPGAEDTKALNDLLKSLQDQQKDLREWLQKQEQPTSGKPPTGPASTQVKPQ